MIKQNSRPVLLILATGFCFCQANSQPANGNFYIFNADWSPAKTMDESVFFMQQIKKSDTEYVCRYYQKNGPMVKQETYRDSDLTIPNGRFCWYNEQGKIDSCGLVVNFKKDGEWDYFFGDSTGITYYQVYDNGKFIKQGSNHQQDSAGKDKDEEIQKAGFQNGDKGWVKYLSKNLITPGRLINIMGAGKYTVLVCFLIDKGGRVSDLYLRKSVEWSADAEIFSIIEKSPLWKPASKNGKPEYYRQIENITYNIN